VDIFALSDLSTPWCVHVVATLRTADHMAAGITQIDERAAASGRNADALYRVLTRLVGKACSRNRRRLTASMKGRSKSRA